MIDEEEYFRMIEDHFLQKRGKSDAAFTERMGVNSGMV